jgi:uncharacterized protein (TIGR02145 family)
MFRYAFLLLCLGVMKPSFSQSKKEQIEILNKRVDSLNQVVSSKDKSINDQTLQINSLNSTITSLEGKITSLNSNVSKLNSEVQTLTSDSKNKQQEINQKKDEINRLELQLKSKSDSLTLLKEELEKLKPVVKPVVNNTPVKNTPSGPYKTVTIGTQVWMKENLNVSTFKNGDPIPEAKTDEEWKRAGEEGKPAWCYYDNDVKNGTKYGKLYNWYAVNDARGLAPSGYHVPTDEEWTILTDYLGGEDVAGTKMKSTSGWESYGCKRCDGGSAEFKKTCTACKGTQSNSTMPFSGNGSNISGFTGLPGGHRAGYTSGSGTTFFYFGEFGFWWSSTEYSTDHLKRIRASWSSWYLHYSNGGPFDISGFRRRQGWRDFPTDEEGFSVRCLKD